jgi:hypothetical protein
MFRITCGSRAKGSPAQPHCMDQPWLTTRDWPVSAFDPNAAKKKGGLGDVFDRCKFPVHCLMQHYAPDYLLFGDAEFLRLLRNLLVDERRAHKTGEDHVRPGPMSNRTARRRSRSDRKTHRVGRSRWPDDSEAIDPWICPSNEPW